MKLLIYSTDINTEQKVKTIRDLFYEDKEILNLSIDLEDIDNVLRIEAKDTISELEIVNKVQKKGFNCVELID